MEKIGFIGLGIMGLPMARNLAKAGFKLTLVSGHAKQAVDELEKAGAAVVRSPREVAAETELVVTCLPDTPDVLDVVGGPNGLLDGARRGLIVVDHSTISPMAARQLAADCERRGVAFLDAPVSGGQQGAIAGTLSIMVGGDAAALARAMPVLEAVGKKIVHVGTSGAGQFTKACNQIICAITWQAIGEGMALGVKAGVDPAKMLEAVSAGAARCWALEVRTPRLLDGDFKPGFMAKLQHKDLVIATDAGRQLGVPLPVTSLVTEFYGALKTAGKGDWDTSSLVTLEEELAKVEIRRKA
ncbi:MAG: NAD(P)-dependent oxidoreductase [Planctomycetes bacterium]|nr:NAD(P)-dependent oxidoreductase [Planctomycetota bacterium]